MYIRSYIISPEQHNVHYLMKGKVESVGVKCKEGSGSAKLNHRLVYFAIEFYLKLPVVVA